MEEGRGGGVVKERLKVRERAKALQSAGEKDTRSRERERQRDKESLEGRKKRRERCTGCVLVRVCLCERVDLCA